MNDALARMPFYIELQKLGDDILTSTIPTKSCNLNWDFHKTTSRCQDKELKKVEYDPKPHFLESLLQVQGISIMLLWMCLLNGLT